MNYEKLHLRETNWAELQNSNQREIVKKPFQCFHRRIKNTNLLQGNWFLKQIVRYLVFKALAVLFNKSQHVLFSVAVPHSYYHLKSRVEESKLLLELRTSILLNLSQHWSLFRPTLLFGLIVAATRFLYSSQPNPSLMQTNYGDCSKSKQQL